MFENPSVSHALQIFRALDKRMALSSETLATYKRLERGHEGEMAFAECVRQLLSPEHQRFFDVSLQINGSQVQYDVLIPTQRTIYHLEIKNYANAYVAQDNQWRLQNGQLILSPLPQVDRANKLLTMLLEKLGIYLPVSSHLIFIHPTFHLYQAPESWPIVYPNQITQFLSNINQKSSFQSDLLYHYFINHHLKKSIFEKIPVYTYPDLAKGCFCHACGGKLVQSSERMHECKQCGRRSLQRDDLLQAGADFVLLFPEARVTTRQIQDWTGYGLTRYQVQRALAQVYQLVSKKRGSHYI